MNKDDTNDESSDEPYESKSGKMLQNFFSGEFQSVYINKNNIRYEQVKTTLELQEEIVCDKMHKAMSPISAISGYLELMKIMLENDKDKESIERYRSKVEEGIGELGEIVEELYDAFDEGIQKNRSKFSTEISFDNNTQAN
jgi:signal transduction histidine kinase